MSAGENRMIDGKRKDRYLNQIENCFKERKQKPSNLVLCDQRFECLNDYCHHHLGHIQSKSCNGFCFCLNTEAKKHHCSSINESQKSGSDKP